MNTGSVVAIGVVVGVLVSGICVFVMDMFVAGVALDSQLVRNRTNIKIVEYSFIIHNVGGEIFFFNDLLSLILESLS